jgi:hypothetical protein
MKDSHIAWIAGGVSWVVLLGGAVGGPAAYNAATQGAYQRVLDQRGMTADVAAKIGEVATLKIPRSFSALDAEEELNPDFHEDPDSVMRTWQIPPPPAQFSWATPFADKPEPQATLHVTIADPDSNMLDVQRMDFSDAPFSSAGPIEILKASMLDEEGDAKTPPTVRYLAVNAAAGLSADLMTDAKLYTDAQARDLLVSVLGSIQVNKSKFDALLAGPRQRQAEEMAAREQMMQDAVERVSALLNLTEQPDGARTSPSGDVLVDNVLYMKLDQRKATPGADPSADGYQLVAPMTDDMTTMYGEQDENMLGLMAISSDSRGNYFSGPVLSAEHLAAIEGEPPQTEPFSPPPQMLPQLKRGDVSLWRAVYLDDVTDSDGMDQLSIIVSQTMEWRKAATKKWAAKVVK